MSSVSARITMLERTIRKAGRDEFAASVDADFANALTRVASNDPIRGQLESARKAFIKSGTPAAEKAALEKFLREKAPEPAPAALVNLDALRNPITVKISAAGERLADDATDYVAVLLPQFDLLYTVTTKVAKNWKEAVKFGSEVELFNDKGEWQLMDDIEAQLIIDRSKVGPAVLAPFAAHTPTDYIYWTRRPYASSPSGSAIYVSMHSGLVDWDYQGYNGRVRACRRVRASQF